MARTDLARRSRDNPNLFDEGAESRPPWTARDDRPLPKPNPLTESPVGLQRRDFRQVPDLKLSKRVIAPPQRDGSFACVLVPEKHGDQRRQRWMSSRT